MILESKAALLNKDIDISRVMVYKKQVEKEKKRKLRLVRVRIKSFVIWVKVEVSGRVVEMVGSGLRRSGAILAPTVLLVLPIRSHHVTIIVIMIVGLENQDTSRRLVGPSHLRHIPLQDFMVR